MNITKILIDEHKNVMKSVEILERKINWLKNGKNLNNDFFKKIIWFIKNYNDQFHHKKEEDILFKEFNKAAEKGCAHCNPVEQMVFEHEEGRKFVREMTKALSEENKDKLIENAASYAELIMSHIFKEDNILYPLAEEAINEEVKRKILKKFQESDQKKSKDKKKCLSILCEIDKR